LMLGGMKMQEGEGGVSRASWEGVGCESSIVRI
jgi:hypothetical protein